MTSTGISESRTVPDSHATTPRRPVTALFAGATVFAATAVLDLVAPATFVGDRAHTVSDYAFIALLFPFVVAAAWIAEELHRWHAGADGRTGLVGTRLVGLGAAGFIVAGAASLTTGDERAVAPLYPISMLVSLIGFLVLAVAFVRGRRLPIWVGPLLPVAWLFGGPVAPSHGLFLLLAALCVAIAVALPRRPVLARS